MSTYLKSDQDNTNVVTASARLPYEPPTLTVMGKVERLTAVFRRGPRDILFRGNLL